MISKLLNLCSHIGLLLKQEHGQDLVEYALIVSMMCFGATAGVKGFASMLNVVITSISSDIAAS